MSLQSWPLTSFIRLFPSTPIPRHAAPVQLESALNESSSFQVGLHTDEDKLRVTATAEGPDGWAVRVRRVGYVPMLHHNMQGPGNPADLDGAGQIPGYVPDPLFDESTVLLGRDETHAFWITIRPSRNTKPGTHAVTVILTPERGRPQRHRITVRIHDLALPKRRNFPIVQWFYADSLMDWYKTDWFDQRFWAIAEPYFHNVVSHGQSGVLVPCFTPPTDGVKRPTQLLHVSRTGRNRYAFDWRDVRRYMRLADRCGVDHFEWNHLFTQWGVKHAIRIYEGQGRGERRLWAPSTGATSPVYRAFLSQFLPELRNFLRREGFLHRTLFHLSDEPHGEEHLVNYRKARQMLREVAPWMKVMDALTDIAFAKQGLTDMPVPSIQSALDFHKAGIPSWCYYCCGPRGPYLNRLMDTPLAKIAMHGFLFYRWPFKGFLHWGYNYWYQSQTRNLIDPFTVQDGLFWDRGWAYGDTFCVYPGPEGPIDSMRWELFGESMQDYQLLQARNVDRNHPLLRPIRTFADFPKHAAWRQKVRHQLLTGKL